MNTMTRPRMKFHSRPQKHRPSLIFMGLVLLMGWIVMPMVVALTYLAIQHDLASGFVGVLFTFTVTVCLLITTRQFLKTCTSDGFELIIESDIVSFFGIDKTDNKLLRRQVPLSSVNEADYYPSADASTIILHSEGKKDLELPLWAFGKDVEMQIVEYLRTRIRVVDIPSAIVI
jgi:hypothetical protein